MITTWKRRASIALLTLLCVGAFAQSTSKDQERINEFAAIEGISALKYNYVREKNLEARYGYGPSFYLFPDEKLDEPSALELVRELGMPKLVDLYGGRICVINPAGEKWQASDVETFRELLKKNGTVTNVKVVAIGQGATFVNQQLAATDLTGAIAGIVSIGGAPGKTCAQPVPAYIAGKHASKAARPYQKTSQSAPADPLQQVVVNTDAKASLATLFADAWDKILSANYRFNNLYRTFYSTRGADNPYGVKNFELVSLPMFDKLDIERHMVEYPVIDAHIPIKPNNPDKYLWYEYLPKQAREAAPGTVPLVVILHGHTNDPRTQSETSGFVELAAEEGFMVVEMEWQGSNGYIAMGLDGIEGVISILKQKYPQLDPSRIYCEGLSAGAITSTMLGVRKSHLFAAVAGHSGGVHSGNGVGYYGYGSEPLMNEAIQKRGYVEVGYCTVVGTDDEVVKFLRPDNWQDNSYLNAWRIYQTINGMEVTDSLDFNTDATFGLQLQDRRQIQTNKGEGITMEFGQLYKDHKPLIRLIAINHYAHWNFKPAARLIWDFFRHFSRDMETKKLVYTE
jgi:poly(3-hydroxybutyrate) depolymerase